MELTEKRIVEAGLEVRAVGDKKQIVGYALKFNSRSLPIGGMFIEQIDARALDDDFTSKKLDVRALFNHDPNMILGRTTAGTLRLSKDDVGVRFEIDPPDTQAGRDAMTSIGRGDVSGCSFSFRCMKGGDEWSDLPDGKMLRTLKKISIDGGDVSPVTFPAYPETEVNMRSLEAMAEEARKRLHPEPEGDHGAGYRARQIQLAEVE